ncbi:hypothetical protein [Terasakiella pusilla]|uniref:hypothetical protein n=1 Tax=Terasakiella pusilla TaxID=64973 RepID=UPI00048FB18F|nr:hypothetical protein [Terasakiella pusilla]
MRINDIYEPTDEPSAFAFTVHFHNPFDSTAVDVFVPSASSQVQCISDKITVLVAALAKTTEELQSMIQNAVLICDGLEFKGSELSPTLSAGVIEVPTGFNGCQYHALHTTYPDFFVMA